MYKHRPLKVGKDWGHKTLIKAYDQLYFNCRRDGMYDNICVVFTGNCRFLKFEIIS